MEIRVQTSRSTHCQTVLIHYLNVTVVGADVAALCRGAATAVREHVRSHDTDEPTAVEDIVLTQEQLESAPAEITGAEA